MRAEIRFCIKNVWRRTDCIMPWNLLWIKSCFPHAEKTAIYTVTLEDTLIKLQIGWKHGFSHKGSKLFNDKCFATVLLPYNLGTNIIKSLRWPRSTMTRGTTGVHQKDLGYEEMSSYQLRGSVENHRVPYPAIFTSASKNCTIEVRNIWVSLTRTGGGSKSASKARSLCCNAISTAENVLSYGMRTLAMVN